jgi:hypothetical protein
VVDQLSGQIICTHFAKGATHDFKLFKASKLRIKPSSALLADAGYQGIQKLIAKAQTPKKSSKHHPLTKADKRANQAQAAKRIKVENVIGFLKRFKVFATKYRNRRKRFGLRVNLFAAIANLDTRPKHF